MGEWGTMHSRCIDDAGDDPFVWTAHGWKCSVCGRFMGEAISDTRDEGGRWHSEGSSA